MPNRHFVRYLIYESKLSVNIGVLAVRTAVIAKPNKILLLHYFLCGLVHLQCS